MAKRIFKEERIRTIIKNIAEDFRFSGETGEYALLFYRADTAGGVHGKEIEQMVEYVTTGLSELQDNIEWRRQFMSENSGMDEMKMLDSLRTIEEEYAELLAFLKK